MTIAFTLCSINYLAQAKSLGVSLKATNPTVKFIIGLVDKNTTNVDLSFLEEFTVLEVADINLEELDEMANRYSIVEFLTSVKPFYFEYLFRHFPTAEKVIYFDPDIVVFSGLDELEDNLNNYEIILTPHFTSPINDNLIPTEKHIYNTGVYNLGFLALSRGENSKALIAWWESRLRKECILDLTAGYFVDQLWMNLAPSFFNKVLVEKNPGYNVAHWNLHERTIAQKEGKYLVNNTPLIFYHFSHYHPEHPGEIAAYHNRFSFDTRPDIKPLFDVYSANLKRNKYFALKQVPCYYLRSEKKKKFKRSIAAFLRKNVPLSMKMKFKKLVQG
jgi:lipopolysaccharide biosynthesis glycosyltransferase